MKPEQLQAMTVKELRLLAANKGLEKVSRLTKAALVAALTPLMVTTSRIRRRASFTAPKFVAPASSSTPPPAPKPPPPPPGSDQGLPIPDRYGKDRLVLMVQDPQHVFAYWEITPALLERIGAAAAGGCTPVLLLHTSGGTEHREVDLRGGNYYLSVSPNASYEAELVLRDSQGRLHRLAKSNRVTTPPATVSGRVDEDWLVVDESMDEMLRSGLALGSSGGSGGRFRNARRLHLKRVAVPASTPGFAWQKETSPLPSSQAVPKPESLSSMARLPSSRALLSSAALQSSKALSSKALSSKALSSKALSSGAVAQDEDAADPTLYPVVAVANPTGLPKAAEGVSSPGPAPGPAAPPPPPGPPPPPPDPLGFVGAPKPRPDKPAPRHRR